MKNLTGVKSSPSEMPLATKSHWSIQDCFKCGKPLLKAFIHKNYTFNRHSHAFYELNIVLGGEGVHYFAGQKFELSKGDVFVIPPDHEHAYFSSRQLDVGHILLPQAFINGIASGLRFVSGFQLLFSIEPFFRNKGGFRYCLHLDEKQLAKIEEILEWMIEAVQQNKPAVILGQEALMLHLLCLLSQWQEESCMYSDIGYDRMQSLKKALFLIENEYSRKISLDELAKIAHMQKNYFCRVFRKATGMRPQEYITHKRVYAARELLLGTDETLNSIAMLTGFYDLSHFSRTFSKIFGSPPSFFRRRKVMS